MSSPAPTFHVRQLDKYQHYHHKASHPTWVPPWCKLYRQFWTDYTMLQLPPLTRLLYLGIISLATELNNRIPADPAYLTSRLGFPVKPDMLKALAEAERIVLDAPMVEAPPPMKALPAPIEDRFNEFWTRYPKKIGKGAAQAAWQKANPQNGLVETILEQVEKAKQTAQWSQENGKFIPHPATWLNQKRWEDDYQPPATHLQAADYLRQL